MWLLENRSYVWLLENRSYASLRMLGCELLPQNSMA